AGDRVLIVEGNSAVEAATGAPVSPLPEARDDLVVNNRLRGEIESAMAGLKLFSPERALRESAVKELGNGAAESMRPLVRKALESETDPDIKASLAMIAAGLDLKLGDKAARIAAVRLLGSS